MPVLTQQNFTPLVAFGSECLQDLAASLYFLKVLDSANPAIIVGHHKVDQLEYSNLQLGCVLKAIYKFTILRQMVPRSQGKKPKEVGCPPPE